MEAIRDMHCADARYEGRIMDFLRVQPDLVAFAVATTMRRPRH